MEEDESGKTKIVGNKIKRLSWESGQLRKVQTLNILDKTMRESQTQRAWDRALSRTNHKEETSRLPPKDFPDWAIQSSE